MVSAVVVQGYRCTGDINGFRVTVVAQGCRSAEVQGYRGTGVVEVFNDFGRSTGIQVYMNSRGVVQGYMCSSVVLW
jgi:hypothetical protein